MVDVHHRNQLANFPASVILTWNYGKNKLFDSKQGLEIKSCIHKDARISQEGF